MKFKAILIGLVMAVMLCASSYAAEWIHASGAKTTDTLIWTGEINFYGFCVATDGTNAITFSIYDNTSNSGTLLFPTTVVTASATDRSRCFMFNTPVRANTGIYVDITIGGGSVGYVVYYGR